MTRKSVLVRAKADADIDAALLDAPDPAALLDELEDVFDRLGRFPASGSPRYGIELGLPDLRHVSLSRAPYLIFYVEAATELVVVRVLHNRRDIPATLAEE